MQQGTARLGLGVLLITAIGCGKGGDLARARQSEVRIAGLKEALDQSKTDYCIQRELLSELARNLGPVLRDAETCCRARKDKRGLERVAKAREASGNLQRSFRIEREP